MIGKSLRERYSPGILPADRAASILREQLETHAKALVEIRAKDARMIACLVVRADDASVRFCRTIGLDIKRGGTGIFGLLGHDAAKVLPDLAADQRAWASAPCGPRETKVLLLAGNAQATSPKGESGLALLSIVSDNGSVDIHVGPTGCAS